MAKLFFSFFSEIVIIFLTINILLAGTTEKKELKVAFVDVGHGDSIIIKTPSNHAILIDGGSKGNESAIKSVLTKFGITKRIDTMILSNPNAEHVGGLSEILNTYDVGGIYDAGMSFIQFDYDSFKELIMKKQDQRAGGQSDKQRLADIMARRLHYEYFNPRAGDILNWGPDVQVTVLSPHRLYHNTRSDPNNNSIVIKLVFNKISFLFTGNVEKDAERYLATMGSKIETTFLKVPNHGSHYSCNPYFVKKAKPKVSILTVGAKNKYGYPSKKVLTRLKELNSKIYRTDLNGTIIVTTDGQSYSIVPEKTTADAEQIVQTTYKAEEGVEDSGNIYAKKKRINVNTASADKLVSISSLGAFKAQMIVKYRTKYGDFRSINDLIKVPGINQTVLNKIKDQITIH